MLTFCQLQNKLNGVQHVTRAQTPCLQKTTKFGVDCAISSGQIGNISAANDVKTAGEAVMNQIWETSKKVKYFRRTD